MGFADFIGGVSNTIQDARGAWSKPRIARERVAKAKSAADQREQIQQSRAQGLLDKVANAEVENQIALAGLPTATKVATVARDIDLGRKQTENSWAQDNQRLTAGLTQDTAAVLGDQGRQTIGAKADAKVAEMSGWAGNVLPAFRENVIAPAQQHELALMDRTFGATAPLELSGQLEREQMGLQREMFDKERQGRLPEWLTQAAGLALGAAALKWG